MKKATFVRRMALLATMPLLLQAVPAKAQQSCPRYAQMVEQALPVGVGGQGLLDTMMMNIGDWTGPGLSTGFNPRGVKAVTGVNFRAPKTCPRGSAVKANPGAFVCEFGADDGSGATLSVNLPEGEVSYTNRSRHFDPSGPDNDVSVQQAIAIAQAAAAGFGVPVSQIADVGANGRAVKMLSTPTNHQAPPSIRRIEVYAQLPRAVQGFPVFDSEVKVAVANGGLLARAHVTWPEFTLAPGAGSGPVSRAAIVADVVEQLGDLASCTKFEKALAMVGWVQASVPDDSDEAGQQQAAGRYLPGVRVVVFPYETEEDSGQLGGQVTEFSVPLVRGTVGGL